MTPDKVRPLLRGRLGRPYTYRESCETTQELVRGLPEGAVAAADVQTAGRGRRGRGWTSPPGAGLLFSLSLRPERPPEELAPLSLVLADAVAAACGADAAVRWPNDVVIGGRKLAGVLPELRDGQVIAGIGINVNLRAEDLPPAARVQPTSLLLERGQVVDRAQLLADVLAEADDDARVAVLDDALAPLAPEPAPAYLELCALVDAMSEDRSVVRVEQAAALGAMSTRSLQRLFRTYVGISPKAVLARYRLQDAAAAIDAGQVTDLATLAAELGWFDQAHFSRDFRSVVGVTPSAYLACARNQSSTGS